jgi:lipoprotein-anchoring transpeptidase ErfK/SrfK
MTITTKRLCGMLLGVLLAGLTAAPASAADPSVKFALPGIGGPDLVAPAPGQPPAAAPPEPATAPAAGAPSSLAVEEKLNALHYHVGAVDGVLDDIANSAVMAFQKVHGLERTGALSDQVAAAIMATTADPPPLVPGGDPHRVEIDLTRQVLFLYEGGALTWILPVSSGASSTPTPTGSYRIYSQRQGWETSRYGRLYNSQYFVGGYAIHGSLSVPGHPASHGCVRIPMSAADILPGRLSIGTPVHVLG